MKYMKNAVRIWKR